MKNHLAKLSLLLLCSIFLFSTNALTQFRKEPLSNQNKGKRATVNQSELQLPTSSIVPPSPTAAALGKYGEVPVNDYTGIPSISVPLYELKSRKNSVPISLSYHAGGNKVDEVSSWVGLGWSLNGGGVITRSIRGLEDNTGIGYTSQGAQQLLGGLDEFDVLDFCNHRNEVKNAAAGNLDGLPDIYNFNVGGYAGRFVIDAIGDVHLIPHQDIKIVLISSTESGDNANRDYEKFELTTPDGTLYRFGKKSSSEDYREMSSSFSLESLNSNAPCSGDASPDVTNATTSWFLYEIVDTNNPDAISFTYSPYNVIHETGISATRFFDNAAANNVCRFAPDDVECINQVITDSWHLSTISSINGSIKFTVAEDRQDIAGGVRLSKIEVFGAKGNTENDLIRSFDLTHDYYNNSFSSENQDLVRKRKRLKLRSIKETEGVTSIEKSATKPATEFLYIGETKNQNAQGETVITESSIYTLPPRLSYAQDHWGFYNGADDNRTLLPAYIFNPLFDYEAFAGANRDTDPEKVKAGILRRITYPTGGYTDFDYEVNTISGTEEVANFLQASSRFTEQIVELNLIGNGNNFTSFSINTTSTEVKVTTIRNSSNGAEWDGSVSLVRTDNGSNQEYCSLICDGGDNGPMTVNLGYLPQGNYKLTITHDGNPETETDVYVDYRDLIVDDDDIEKNIAPSQVINVPVGGIRVKEIVSYTQPNNAAIIKTYNYNKHGEDGTLINQSSGRLINYPRYGYNSINRRNNPTTGCQNCEFRTLVSSPKSPLGTSQGRHVVYPNVTINYGESGEGGFCQKEYSYFGDKGGSGFPYTFQTSNDWKRGKLIEQRDYKITSTGNKLVHSITNNWDYGDDRNVRNVTIKALKIDRRFNEVGGAVSGGGNCSISETTTSNECIYLSIDDGGADFGFALTPENMSFTYPQTTAQSLEICGDQITCNPRWIEQFGYRTYDHYSRWITLESQTEVMDGVATTRTYEYDPQGRHTNPIAVQFLNSDGRLHRTETKYAHEIGNTEMVNRNMISIPLEVEEKIDGNIVNGSLTTYTQSGDILPQTISQKLVGGNDLLRMTINSYDDNDNITQATRKHDQPVSYIWSYDNTRPVAVVQNALTTEIAYTGFEQVARTGSAANGGWEIRNVGLVETSDYPAALWSNPEQQQVSGTNRIKLESGIEIRTTIDIAANSEDNPNTNEYILAFWYRNGTIVAENGSGNEIPEVTLANEWTYFEEKITLNGGLLRLSSPEGTTLIDELRLFPADALMTAYTYDENTRQMTSMTYESGQVVNHEYDGFQRLVAIKDVDGNIEQTYAYNYHTNQNNPINSIEQQTVFESGNRMLPVTYNPAIDQDKLIRTYQHLDGLGRTIQTVAQAQSPANNDIITTNEYDLVGRLDKTYLPYTVDGVNSGNYRPQMTVESGGTEQEKFYADFGETDKQFAFSSTVYEPSPLNRTDRQGAPGFVWTVRGNDNGNGHEVKTTYRANTTEDKVRLFKDGNSPGFYPPNSLMVTKVEDENGHFKWTFLDKLGRTVMTKQEDDRQYYVYDANGDLEAVIPSIIVTVMKAFNSYDYTYAGDGNGDYNEQFYRYSYDNRHRMIYKQLPNVDGKTYHYDRLDRLALTIDGNGYKTFIKYDILNRPIMTGRYTGTATPVSSEASEATCDSECMYEDRFRFNAFGYTLNQAFPQNISDYYILTTTHYDDYDLNNDGSISDGENFITEIPNNFYEVPSVLSRGKTTASRVAILKYDGDNEEISPNVYLTNQTYYDQKGRVVQTREDNYTGSNSNSTDKVGEDVTFIAYDFANRMTYSYKQHNAAIVNTSVPEADRTIEKAFDYDHAGRLTEVTQRVDGKASITIAANEYNERNQLIEKALHLPNGNTPTPALQAINYAYNIRGWLTNINDVYSDECPEDDGDVTDTNRVENETLSSARNTRISVRSTHIELTQPLTTVFFTIDISSEVQNLLEGVLGPYTGRGLYATYKVVISNAQGQEPTIISLAETTEDLSQITFPYTMEVDLSDVEITPLNIGEVLLRYEKELFDKFGEQLLSLVSQSTNYPTFLLIRNVVYNTVQRGIESRLLQVHEAEQMAVHTTAARTPAGPDLFSLYLQYDDDFKDNDDSNPDEMNGKAQYNGNIAAVHWKTTVPKIYRYAFNYDQYDRITAAHYDEFQPMPTTNAPCQGRVDNRNFYHTEYNYSERIEGSFGTDGARGNLTNLIRRGMIDGTPAKPTYGRIDNLLLENNLGAKLTCVVENFEHYSPITDRYNEERTESGFKTKMEPTEGTTNTNEDYAGMAGFYDYDGNGNLIRDQHKRMIIAHNHLNLPHHIDIYTDQEAPGFFEDKPTIVQSISWIYDAAGRKWGKRYGNEYKYYVGEFEYTSTGGASLSNLTTKLEAIYHEEGRYVPQTTNSSDYDYEYCLKDHLGNTRVMVRVPRTGGNASVSADDIIQQNHYYPFGMQMDLPAPANAIDGEFNPYTYNGKEAHPEEDLDWLDYGARWYEPAIARFIQVDPLAEEYYGIMPYVYGLNNPIRFIDPDGMAPCPPGVDCGNLPDDAVVTSSNKGQVVQQVDQSIQTIAKDGRTSANLDNPNAAAEAYDQSRMGGTGTTRTDLHDYIINDNVTIEVTQEYDASTIEYAESIETNDEFNNSLEASSENSSSISGNVKGNGKIGPIDLEANVEASTSSNTSSSNSSNKSMSGKAIKTHVYNADIITTTRVTIGFNFSTSSKTTVARSRGSFRSRNRVSTKQSELKN